MIPGGLGIDDGDGALKADTEAVGFGSMDQGLRTAEIEFLEPAFQELPRGHPFFRSYYADTYSNDTSLIHAKQEDVLYRCARLSSVFSHQVFVLQLASASHHS